jgi:predicted amidohydrolase YtcJ
LEALRWSEALEAHTRAAAALASLEGIGQIRVGMRADFVVVSSMHFSSDGPAPEVLQTFVDGACVAGQCGGVSHEDFENDYDNREL